MRALGVAQRARLLSIALSGLALGACYGKDSDSAPTRRRELSATGERRVSIAVTADGFVPQRTYVTAGEPVILIVTRIVADTCAKDLVLEEYAILAPLPLGEPVEVRFTPARPGRIRFSACAMNMVAGEIVAQ
jgi:plastocyanin domain-containing protein